MSPTELTPRTIRTVKSTAPILREQGLNITRRMYEIMFQDKRIRSMFNQAHHGQEGTQPRALAGAVHAYADNIDRLDELGPMIERIAQKHVALNVFPEHYPHVGRSLVGALHDVLGQAATGEVMKAWMEAYDFLADVLIQREAEIYREHSDQPGGWVGWREFSVDRVAPESETIKSLYLVPSDGGQMMSFRPGQYLTFQFDVPGHGPIVRNYSISCAPGRDYYRITVKQEGPTDAAPYAPPGLGSTYLHEDISHGDTLQVSAPAGCEHSTFPTSGSTSSSSDRRRPCTPDRAPRSTPA